MTPMHNHAMDNMAIIGGVVGRMLDVSSLDDIDTILSLLPSPQKHSRNFEGEFHYIDDSVFSG